jgi:quinol monooxygenase YgiN
MCTLHNTQYISFITESGHTYIYIVMHDRIPELFSIINSYKDGDCVPSHAGRLAIKELIAQLSAYYAESSEINQEN